LRLTWDSLRTDTRDTAVSVPATREAWQTKCAEQDRLIPRPWEPRIDLETGIERTLDYYRRNGDAYFE
jgi:hypothetical protein